MSFELVLDKGSTIETTHYKPGQRVKNIFGYFNGGVYRFDALSTRTGVNIQNFRSWDRNKNPDRITLSNLGLRRGRNSKKISVDLETSNSSAPGKWSIFRIV